MQHSPRATVIWQVSFHMRFGQELEWSSKRKQNQPASLNQINPEMLKKGCALLRHPHQPKMLRPLVRISKANALQALLQPFESGLECKSASRVCQVSAATLWKTYDLWCKLHGLQPACYIIHSGSLQLHRRSSTTVVAHTPATYQFLCIRPCTFVITLQAT